MFPREKREKYSIHLTLVFILLFPGLSKLELEYIKRCLHVLHDELTWRAVNLQSYVALAPSRKFSTLLRTPPPL